MSDQPSQGTMIAAAKGLAIASSLLTAGQLGATSTLLPTLYPAAHTSHRLAARQFAAQYHLLRLTLPPVELITTALCTGLAYIQYTHHNSAPWKLWTAAAAAMVLTIPWSVWLMEPPSRKLLWVSEVAETATKTAPIRPSGVGVRVISPSPERAGREGGGRGAGLAGGMLGVPSSGRGVKAGAITPMEEFEPFEDGVMDEKEYVQLKVTNLLKRWNALNVVRALGPLSAGVLGLWAALTE